VSSWDLKAMSLKSRLPEILCSSDAGRAIVLEVGAGERLADHQRAWLVMVEVATAEGERAP
jgi:hypothetical protein